MNQRDRLQCAFGTLVLGALLAFPASTAAADPSPDGLDLPALLRAGAAASKARKWDACIDAYKRAADIQEDVATLGELGICEEAVGRFADAHSHLRRAVAGMAAGTKDRDRYQAALGRAAEQVAIVLLTIEPAEARVVLDGRPLGRYDGRGVAVAPGKHTFSARLAGYEDASRQVEANARDFPNIQLTLRPKPRAAPPPPIAPASPDRAPWYKPALSPRGVLVPLAAASLATLTVSAGVTIGLAVHAQSMHDALVRRGFNASTCTPSAAPSSECEEIYARQRQRNTARDVLIGTGIAAGAAVGLASLTIALEQRGPKVAVTASANGGGIVVLGTW